MSRRREQSSNSSPFPREAPNAFAPSFLEEIARREPAPAVPETLSEGPFRVLRHFGDGPPLWACHAAGERQARLTVEAPDLAYLAAAALAVAERPLRFRFQPDAEGRLHLLEDGRPVGTASRPEWGSDTLALHLTALAALRARPLALAHYLLSVPDDALRRAGRILVERLREAGR